MIDDDQFVEFIAKAFCRHDLQTSGQVRRGLFDAMDAIDDDLRLAALAIDPPHQNQDRLHLHVVPELCEDV